MKIVRILILLTMTSMVPTFLTPAIAQQEVDPEHFDPAELAKTARSTKQPKAGPKAAALTNQQKPVGKTTRASRVTPRPSQAKAESQQVAAVHPTGE